MGAAWVASVAARKSSVVISLIMMGRMAARAVRPAADDCWLLVRVFSAGLHANNSHRFVGDCSQSAFADGGISLSLRRAVLDQRSRVAGLKVVPRKRGQLAERGPQDSCASKLHRCLSLRR